MVARLDLNASGVIVPVSPLGREIAFGVAGHVHARSNANAQLGLSHLRVSKALKATGRQVHHLRDADS